METELTSREELVRRANSLGLSFAPATGNEKLMQMISQAENEMVNAEGAESFDQEQFRNEAEVKARIEAEARAKVAMEMKPKKPPLKRKPSPEEVIVKTHPTVDVEFHNGDGSETPLHCTYGGVRYLCFPGKSYQLPFGFADHLQYHCQYPVYEQVPDPESPGETMPKRVGWQPRFNLRILDHSQYATAEETAKALGYIPIKERNKDEKGTNSFSGS
jgi:hypothetical protein